MSFYNTGNPVPSIDPRDLDDNAKHLDEFVNGTEPTYTDRLGVERKTLSAIESDADSELLKTDLGNTSNPLKGAGLVPSVIRTVNTISEMVAMNGWSVGQRIQTLGYSSVGDGGANIYTVITKGSLVVDGGRYISTTDPTLIFRGEFVDGSVRLKQFGATAGANNSSIIQIVLNYCSANRVKAILDVDSQVAGVSIPSGSEIHQRCNFTNPINGGTALFSLTSVSNVVYFGNRRMGFSITRTGTARAFNITSTTSFGVSNVELDGIEIKGGGGTGIYWYNVDQLNIHDCNIHDIGGTAIYGADVIQNSRKVRINQNFIQDLASASTICHGISINQWHGTDDVEIHDNHVYRTRNNPIEIWASGASIKNNTAVDGAINISCGVCTRLTISGNTCITTDPTAGKTVYGIEVGGCHTFNVSDNLVIGADRGIYFSGAGIGAASGAYFPTRFSPTSLYSEAGRLDYLNPALLKVLSPRDTTDSTFSGSYVGVVTNNIIASTRNYGIFGIMDNYFTESVLISGNKVTGQGRAITPTGGQGALSLTGGRFELHGNSFSDSLSGVIITNATCYFGANSFKNITGSPLINILGVSARANFACRQEIYKCVISQAAAGATPSQGTWEVGDVILSHAPAAGGSLGIMCTTAGTQSTQLNTTTATTTSASAVITVSAITADMQIGNTFTIAGVTGRKRIVDIDISNGFVTLDVACDASVSSAAITNSAATFKSIGSVAA